MINIARKIILTILVFLLIYSFTKNIFSYRERLAFYDEYNQEYQKELQKNKKLKSELKNAQDYYAIEKKIRQDLNLLKPNEEAIILPYITITPTPTPKIEKPPHQEWIDLLML